MRDAIILAHFDEGRGDLDGVEREAVQIAQRGVAGAKVIERQTQPQIAQRLQHIGRVLRIGHHLALGDLKLEMPRQSLVLTDEVAHVVQQGFRRQLRGREIDRDEEILGQPDIVHPVARLCGGLFKC